jgi:hypothetical protein
MAITKADMQENRTTSIASLVIVRSPGLGSPSHNLSVGDAWTLAKKWWRLYQLGTRAYDGTSTVGGTLRPSALEVLRLMTSSYLVGACTGSSAAFSPLRMRST